MINLKSHVAILEPLKGIATKKDRKACGEVCLKSNRDKYIIIHSKSKRDLESKLDKVNLSKPYVVIIITEKQFSKISTIDHWITVVTMKQIKESFIIKGNK